MRLLLLADTEDPSLWDYYTPLKTAGVDLVISAGDLKGPYLSFLVTMVNRPLLYVHGNHDSSYEKWPPEGCDCIDDELVTVKGLRILGLGGSQIISDGYYYSEKDMRKRIRRLRRKIKKAGGVDIVVTHSPALGYGDEDNPSHRGYEAFLELIDEFRPRFFIYGHVHESYSHEFTRRLSRGDTTLINASGKYFLDI